MPCIIFHYGQFFHSLVTELWQEPSYITNCNFYFRNYDDHQNKGEPISVITCIN